MQDKSVNVAIFVIVSGDRSSYFTIFKLATINEIYEMTHILDTRSFLHCTDLKNLYLAGDLKATAVNCRNFQTFTCQPFLIYTSTIFQLSLTCAHISRFMSRRQPGLWNICPKICNALPPGVAHTAC